MIRSESETLEFKASFGEWKEAIQALCAFANAKGGRVVIGLDDTGQPTDLEIGKSSIEDFLNKVRLNTDPVLYPSVTVRTFGPCEIVEVLVEENPAKPVFAFDRAYVRVGKTTQKLSAHAIKEMARANLPGEFDTRITEIPLEGWTPDGIASHKLDFEVIGSDVRLVRNGRISTALYLASCPRNIQYDQAILKGRTFQGRHHESIPGHEGIRRLPCEHGRRRDGVRSPTPVHGSRARRKRPPKGSLGDSHDRRARGCGECRPASRLRRSRQCPDPHFRRPSRGLEPGIARWWHRIRQPRGRKPVPFPAIATSCAWPSPWDSSKLGEPASNG